MSTPAIPANQGSSTRPYLIRALHDWCTDNGFTPYIAVHVDASVRVPNEYVKNGEIVLNVGFEATTGLKLGNEWIEFKARFGGTARDIAVPVSHVIAIYARENGQGMAFPVPADAAAGGARNGADGTARGPSSTRGLRLASIEESFAEATAKPAEGGKEPPPTPPAAPAGARRGLKRIK